LTNGIRLFVFSLAVIVNGAAMAVLHIAMIQVADHEKLAMHRPARIVVTGQKQPSKRLLTTGACPSSERSL
jgi:hypothetical protein